MATTMLRSQSQSRPPPTGPSLQPQHGHPQQQSSEQSPGSLATNALGSHSQIVGQARQSTNPPGPPPRMVKGVFSRRNDAEIFLHRLKDDFPAAKTNAAKFDEHHRPQWRTDPELKPERPYPLAVGVGYGERYTAVDGREHAFWIEEMVVQPDLESHLLVGSAKIMASAREQAEAHKEAGLTAVQKKLLLDHRSHVENTEANWSAVTQELKREQAEKDRKREEEEAAAGEGEGEGPGNADSEVGGANDAEGGADDAEKGRARTSGCPQQ